MASCRCDGRHPDSVPVIQLSLGGRPPEPGGEFAVGGPATWGIEQAVTATGRHQTPTCHASSELTEGKVMSWCATGEVLARLTAVPISRI